MRLCEPPFAFLLVATAALAVRAPRPLIAAGDLGTSAFQLVRVDYSAPSPFTPLGAPLQGWVLAQGDATAYDGNATFFAVLTACPAGAPDYSASGLFAFDAFTGAQLFNYTGFPSNYTMGALGWEPSLGLVGLCGSLLVDGRVEGYCGLDIGARVPRLIKNWRWSLLYDPDTRALDPARHIYYHRLYNTSWMPDYFVSLDSRTGELLRSTQFSSPEFSGTRVNTRTGGLWSICNAPAGLDLCGVDPVTGAFAPTGAFDKVRQNDFLYAATAAVDAANGLYMLTAQFEGDGTWVRVVDIDATSPTFGDILYNFTASKTPWLSNSHVLSAPDGGRGGSIGGRGSVAGPPRPLIGARYFAGWYNCTLYPGQPCWSHFRGFAPKGAPLDNFFASYPERAPLLGLYSTDVATITSEIAAADTALDFFSMLYYQGDAACGTNADPNLAYCLVAPLAFMLNTTAVWGATTRLHFFITYSNDIDSGRNGMFVGPAGAAAWSSLVATWVGAMSHPRYLKINGRPVFEVLIPDVFSNQCGGNASLGDELLAELRAAGVAAGVGEVLVGGGWANPSVPGTQPPAPLPHPAGYMRYPTTSIPCGQSCLLKNLSAASVAECEGGCNTTGGCTAFVTWPGGGGGAAYSPWRGRARVERGMPM